MSVPEAAGWLSLSISACRACVNVGQAKPAGRLSMPGALAVCTMPAAHHHDVVKLPTHQSALHTPFQASMEDNQPEQVQRRP